MTNDGLTPFLSQRLGYRGPSSVSHAVRRTEKAPDELRKIADKLEAKLC